MNILYDVSMLSFFHQAAGGKKKRGMYRVIEELLNHLHPKIQLELSSTECWSGIESYVEIRGRDLSHLDMRLPICNTFENYINQFIENSKAYAWRLKKSNHVGRRLGGQLISRQADFFNYKKIQRESSRICLDGIDLFHQPSRYYIPEYIKNYKRKGFHRVMTVHDFIPFDQSMSESERKWASMFRRVLDSLNPEDAVICISDYVKEEATQYLHIDPARIFVAKWAANPEIFFPCDNQDLIKSTKLLLGLGDAPYFLCLSTMDPRKNMQMLIQIFGEICRQQKNFECNLVLVGNILRTIKEEVEMLIEQEGLIGRVFLTGYLDDQDLSPLYSGAVAFLFPSLSEGFGLPPLEAMQCGAPVIASNKTSIPEVMGNAGILLDPLCEDDWSAAILNIAKNTQLQTTLSMNGINQSKEFTWNACAEQHSQIYQKIINH